MRRGYDHFYREFCMSISMNVKISGLQQLKAELAGFSDRRLRAATATALTRTAKHLASDWQKEIDTKIDRPTPMTKSAVRIEPARANKLSAKVALKDVSRSGSLSQNDYLQQHELGGSRLVKKFERALIASGAMPQGYITVPGKGADRNGFGNVPRSTIIAVISQLGTDFSEGYQQTISKDATKRAKSQARHGKRYFVMPVGNGRVSPGVYMRGADRNMKMVFAFKRVVNYSRKLTLQDAAKESRVQAIAAQEFDRAISESMARMRSAK